MPNIKRRRNRLIIFLAFLVVASILGALMLQKYRDREQMPATPVAPQTSAPTRVTLFFASPDGDRLVREGREIEACGDDITACIRATLEQLVSGPMGDLAPTLPPATVINKVQIRDDTAYLDFGRQFAAGLPGGSSAEMAAVYSVVDTLALNFPRIRKVKFLLDGRDLATLNGHLDLRMPIEPDFGLEKSNGGQADPEQR